MTRIALIILVSVATVGGVLILLGGSDTTPLTGDSSGNVLSNTQCAGANIDKEFEKDVTANLNHNLAVYKQAESATGVPWAVLAGMHYRESGMSPANPPNGEGPMGLHDLHLQNPNDPALSNFPKAVLKAATFLTDKVKGKLVGGKKLSSDPELIKEALWRYNGTGSAPVPDRSAYVMNNIDAGHTHMNFLGKTDSRNGAYTVYALLNQAVYDASGNFTALSGTCVGFESQGGPSSGLQAQVVANAIRIANELQRRAFPSIDNPGTTVNIIAFDPRFPDLITPGAPKQTGRLWCTYLPILAYQQAGHPLTPNITALLGVQNMAEYFQKNQIYINNGAGAPQPGDTLFINDGRANKFGHVAVITAVSDNQIEVRQSDVHSKTTANFPRQGNSLGKRGGDTPLGWGRVKQ